MIPNSTRIRLQHQHEIISWMIYDLTDAQLIEHPNPGKWSIFEILVHLSAYQHIFLDRIEKIISGKNPEFERYNAEEDPVFILRLNWSQAEILKDLFESRHIIIYRIFDLSDGQLNRKGTHPKYGSLNVTGWTEFFLLHEAHHLYSIFGLAAMLKSGAEG